jgi:hypothetical protein
MRWTEHVVSKEEMRSGCTGIVGNPEEKIPLGIQRC